ncbi:glycoside hydrolase family 3 protein [Alteromonas halophila]|uniref:Glucan 1,4-beta-glucosidase n=1 Tax=Alteromonas halophila TaxID=516698 RepID=A0A918MW14_9ALTE|nr:glycoside hydrolase family 3 N-terminal domain-containing protein [Alteromonas halophila]GGW78104.1 glucan 1,4-beta-glucosidase [Alteromonas halophila]
MRFRLKHSLTMMTSALLLTACQQSATDSIDNTAAQPASAATDVPDYWPEVTYETANREAVEQQVDALLGEMTLEQKVAQLIQPEIREISVEDMRKYGFGSYLNGGGAFPNNDKQASVDDWVALAESLYQASVDDSLDGSSIPTMWGTDAVHGHNNVIGATLFPHNIGLGAMRDAELVTDIAEVTAREVRATGIDWIFAPTVATARDDRWGRTYESYSEDPDVVGAYSRAIVTGLQGDISDGQIDGEHVISTVKHFIGDGGTEGGDDQGNNLASEKDLFEIHGQGYVHGLNAGAQSVMASFNSWHGKKIHGSRYLLTDVLKEKMGFDGFVVGDWNGHGQIEGCTNANCPQAINAGLDVYMVPTSDWKPLYENLIAQVKDGTISQARLDDAVRRVLRVKVRVGLFEQPSPANRALSADTSVIGAPAHREVAREAVRKSLVMLKNQNNLLPLSPDTRVLVAGDAAHNIGKQSGGWTITWQGTGNKNSDFPGATSIYQGIESAVTEAGGTAVLSEDGSFSEKPDVAVVVFGENPYAEGNGDLSNLEYQRGDKTDLALLESLQAEGIPVVSVFITGRPLWVNPELNASDAFVVAWLPGSEGQGVADVLFTGADGTTTYPMQGKLSFSWPATPTQIVNKDDGQKALFPYGYGLSYGDDDPLSAPLPEDAGAGNELILSHDIYVRNLQKPWQLSVEDGSGTAVMSSSTLTTDHVRVRTSDRKVQEDTLDIQFTGPATVRFGSQFPEDLRDYATRSGALVMDVKLASTSTPIMLGMGCGSNCSAALALSDYATSTTDWQTVVIPTQCLQDAGVAFAEVFSVLELTSDTATSLRLSNVRIEPDVDAPGSCSN